MPGATAIDPDHFLDLARSEPFTREEGLAAWEQAYAKLEHRLSSLGARAELFVVFGLQAGGKSTWVEHTAAFANDRSVFFSGPLPSRKHRQRALALAKRFGCRVVAVWVRVSLEVALQRNAKRMGLARVPESVIHHVHESLEPPDLEEGFHEVIVVSPEVDA